MISILLADDHQIVRTGIKLLINREPDMKVMYEALDGEETVELAIANQPDIVVMDLNMPKKNGIISTKQIHEAHKNIKVIILTMYEDKEYIIRALEAGASGYLLKKDNEDNLIDAIRTVHMGDAYLYKSATTFLLEHYLHHLDSNGKTVVSTLTGKEEEILTLLARGYTNREIAELLFVSIKTIESHRSRIMEKLNLKSRKDIIEYAVKNKLYDFM